MSSFLSNAHESSVCINDTTTSENVTYYSIAVTVGSFYWKVQHRFSDFANLHDVLVADHGVAKELLPPKKVLGSKSQKFIEQRKDALNEYMKAVFNYLKLTMPPVFAHFLHFHFYDTFFILRSLAMKFFNEGDKLLESKSSYSFTPLELHSISERIKVPCPAMEKADKVYDFSHILDFCSQLQHLIIDGSYETIGTSNIIPNNLTFDLISFKSLQSLAIHGVPMTCLIGVGALRDNLKCLSVNVSEMKALSDFLLCDVVHRDPASIGEEMNWKSLTSIDLGSNNIAEVDWSVRLMSNLEKLSLTSNRLNQISSLSCLPFLSTLDLSMNNFENCDDFYSKMGNVVSIDLSQNKVVSLKGFSKLYSLESLNLSCNMISDIEEVQHICKLPCLENLWFTGNPVASVIDYRVKVIEQFNTKMGDICLDNEKASPKELDTARVLQALRIVRTGKTPDFLLNNNSSISQKS